MEFSYIYGVVLFLIVMNMEKTRRAQGEEDEFNPDVDDAQSGWEHKVLHCRHARFKAPDALAEALTLESAAGWMLLEKLDDKRLRLTRPVSARDGDTALDFDPYRASSPTTV